MSMPEAQTAAKTYCDRGNGGGGIVDATTSITEISCFCRSRSSMISAANGVGEIVGGRDAGWMVDQIARPPRAVSRSRSFTAD